MAEIFPFRALRYSPARVELARVVTQPYDKITPAMQESYYSASPYNLVRIILGKSDPGDGDGNNVYTRAADYLNSWRSQGILAQDSTPSIYVYSQRFTVPGTNQQAERRGFIAAGRLYDYSEGVVFRHEQTLAKPKSDRLNLLRATRAHFGQIFMLYSDAAQHIDSLLMPQSSPAFCVRDEYDVQHQLWPVADSAIIAKLQQLMRDKKLIIADGHHRYETALNYRNERRSGQTKEGSLAPYDSVMMTFINMDAPGLAILPTHRVISGLSSPKAAKLLSGAAPFFAISELKLQNLDQALQQLREAGRTGTAFLLATRSSLHLLTARSEKIADALNHLSPRQRQLDVTILHKLLLEKILGLSEESIRNQENISYYRDATEAISRVSPSSGQPTADFAFLLNPVRIEQMRDVALAGEVMPQKSTDFYPKLLSGLTIYALD